MRLQNLREKTNTVFQGLYHPQPGWYQPSALLDVTWDPQWCKIKTQPLTILETLFSQRLI